MRLDGAGAWCLWAALLGVVACGPASPPGREASEDQPVTIEARALVLEVRLTSDSFGADEPVRFRAFAMNRGTEPVTVWSSGFYPNHRLDVLDERGELAPLTPQGRLCRARFGEAASDKSSRVEIAPGDSLALTGELDLRDLYVLEPGAYSIVLTYEEEAPPGPSRVSSAPARFLVRGAAKPNP